MTTLTVNVAGKVAAPRGAAWPLGRRQRVASVAHWSVPLASTHSPIVEAAQVRALARSYLNSDPGFAADLFAAADRHESTNGAR